MTRVSVCWPGCVVLQSHAYLSAGPLGKTCQECDGKQPCWEGDVVGLACCLFTRFSAHILALVGAGSWLALPAPPLEPPQRTLASQKAISSDKAGQSVIFFFFKGFVWLPSRLRKRPFSCCFREGSGFSVLQQSGVPLGLSDTRRQAHLCEL